MYIYRLQDISELGHTTKHNVIDKEYFYMTKECAVLKQKELAEYRDLYKEDIDRFLPIEKIDVYEGDKKKVKK